MQGREQAQAHGRGAAAMSSITAGTYPAESVSSSPTPPPSTPPHPAPAPAIQRFDFGGDPEEEDFDFLRAVEYIERARKCACGRGGRCVVERDEQRGRWVYVCPAKPKCNYVSVCEEVGLDSELLSAVRSNNCMINIGSNHETEPRTPIHNVNLQETGTRTPNIVSPQATIPKTPLNSTFQSAGTSTPLHVSPKGPSTTAAVKISPQGAGSNHKWCKCGAGKCTVLRKGSEDYYVCPILKGHGACSYMVPVVAAVNEPTRTGTSGDKHLKDNLVEREDNGNNLDQALDNNANGSVNPLPPDEKEVQGNNLLQAQDNDINGSVNPLQPDEKEVHGNSLVQPQDNNANGSANSQSDDEWPFEVVDNEIIPTAQMTTSAEVRQASPSMKCETTAMAEAPTESPVPPYDTSKPIDPYSENSVSPSGRILQACGELMISCCSGLCPP